MPDELLEKVRKAIELTGYPLELESASIAEQRGWIPFHSVQYPDPTTQKLRELDLLIYKNINQRRLELHISCKSSSNKQFVFFTCDRGHYPAAMDLKFTPVIDNIEHRRSIPDLLSNLRFFASPREAVNYTMLSGPMVDRDAKALLYDAIMSTVTSIHHRPLPHRLLFDQRGTIYFFVVLVRGRMFDARFDHSIKSMVVEETDYAQWCGQFTVPDSYLRLFIDDHDGKKVPFTHVLHWFGDWIRVEFVKDTYFPSYLDHLEQVFGQLEENAISIFGKPWLPEHFPKIVKEGPRLKPKSSIKRKTHSRK